MDGDTRPDIFFPESVSAFGLVAQAPMAREPRAREGSRDGRSTSGRDTKWRSAEELSHC
jgi:hypothetical protein